MVKQLINQKDTNISQNVTQSLRELEVGKSKVFDGKQLYAINSAEYRLGITDKMKFRNTHHEESGTITVTKLENR